MELAMRSLPVALALTTALLSGSSLVHAQSLTVSPSGSIRISPDNNNVGQGKETAPGQLKKTYGGSATDYAPGQQKKSDGSWTLKVDDGNKPKSSSKDKGGQDKSTGKKP
jgi:hypothetical protein